jgi:hypothetical protein
MKTTQYVCDECRFGACRLIREGRDTWHAGERPCICPSQQYHGEIPAKWHEVKGVLDMPNIPEPPPLRHIDDPPTGQRPTAAAAAETLRTRLESERDSEQETKGG